MYLHVFLKITFRRRVLTTHVTTEGFLPCVRSGVLGQAISVF